MLTRKVSSGRFNFTVLENSLETNNLWLNDTVSMSYFWPVCVRLMAASTDSYPAEVAFASPVLAKRWIS